MRKRIGIVLVGAALIAGCASSPPPVAMHGGDPADPAASVAPFEPPPNTLAEGVGARPGRYVPSQEHRHHQGFPSGGATATVYTCPMHPEVTSSDPGECPECGMLLKAKDPE